MLASSRAPRGGANARGRIWNPPLRMTASARPPGKRYPGVTTNLCRGRFHIGPGTPRRRKRPGRIWNPPLRMTANARPPGKRYPRVTTNLCRGRCLHRPAHPVAPQTPAGGINPAPTNKFCASGQTGTAATHPDDRRAGCPHPAAPRGGANAPGGYGIRPYGRRRTPRRRKHPRNGRDRPPPPHHPAPLHKGAFFVAFLQKHRALFVASARRRGHPAKFYNLSAPRGVFTAGHSWYDRTMYPP